jgi:hypothetical protein
LKIPTPIPPGQGPGLGGTGQIGNRYETDLLGAKAADVALTGLIRQTEDQKKNFGEDMKPDFVADDLRGAFKEISEVKASMNALREKKNE